MPPQISRKVIYETIKRSHFAGGGFNPALDQRGCSPLGIPIILFAPQEAGLTENVYIGAIRGGVHSSEFDLLRRSLSFTYLCSVVSAELHAGAIDSLALRLTTPFVLLLERVGRVVTPSHRSWSEAGRILGRIRKEEPQFRSKLPALFNDALIALSASQIGGAVCTRNKEDFELLRRYRKFELELFTDKV